MKIRVSMNQCLIMSSKGVSHSPFVITTVVKPSFSSNNLLFISHTDFKSFSDMDANIKLSEFVTEQLRLLDLEKAAEAQKEKAEQRENGEVISVLVEKTQIPRYGGTVVTLTNRNPHKKHAIIRRGENVALDKCDGSEPLPGILVKVGFNTYDVSVKEDKAIFTATKKWDIIKVPNMGQFLEMERALRDILKNQSPLRNVLFGLKAPSQIETPSNQLNPLFNFASSMKNALLGIEPPTPGPSTVPVFNNTSLDKSQRKAVESTLNQKELSVVHGPPGTGKTTTLVEIIWQVMLFLKLGNTLIL